MTCIRWRVRCKSPVICQKARSLACEAHAAPAMEDNEVTFAQLQERIAKTLRFIESVDVAKLEGDESREIVVKGKNHELKFTAHSYVTAFAVPNFYFHITTAYNILRHLGVNIGKADFIGAI